MPQRVAAFTDTYLPTINGVTYTVKSWRDRWRGRGGHMDVVYPGCDDYDPEPGEFPVRSVPFPWYDGFRMGTPQVPDAAGEADVVHAHTPFALGLGALRTARKHDVPLVASYHTPTAEYADYISVNGRISTAISRAADRYEQWFFEQCELVLAPSTKARDELRARVGPDVSMEVVPNGVDTERFRPVDTDDFLARHDLETDRPLVGYTGRHGYEKCLEDIIDATADLDVTVIFGGDGPARADLEARAADTDTDVRFLGFLDREELPAFYSALDVFAFPSPVETQGIVALEANACGTPVVGVDSGALADTIHEGETGYRFTAGDVRAFREAIQRAIDERERLSASCLDAREAMSVEHAVDQLSDVYDRLQ